MADSFSTADDLNFLPVIKKNALKAVEDVIFDNFGFKPSYEIVNLKNTRNTKKVDINSSDRYYRQECSSIQDKQGLYVIFNTPQDSSLVSDIFYVGKAGKLGSRDAVFYKSTGGGSGRIPLHIQGSGNTIFAKASNYEKGSDDYHDFVDQYSVLCMIIDANKIGLKFDQLLLWWEAYLILVLKPKMNETLEFDMEIIRSSTEIQKRLTPVITELMPILSRPQ